jgi:hypothetical protein
MALPAGVNMELDDLVEIEFPLNSLASQTHPGMLSELEPRAIESILKAKPSIQSAKRKLLSFLSSES